MFEITQTKKSPEEITSWEDADSALKRISIMKTSIDKDEAEYNQKEQELRNKLMIKHAPMQEIIQSLELELENFCIANRMDFGDKKSKELIHGIVKFQVHSPSVEIIKGSTWDDVIKIIKSSKKWASKFIRSKEDINKPAIITANNNGDISEKELKQLMLSIEQKETFSYKLKYAFKN